MLFLPVWICVFSKTPTYDKEQVWQSLSLLRNVSRVPVT